MGERNLYFSTTCVCVVVFFSNVAISIIRFFFSINLLPLFTCNSADCKLKIITIF